MKNRLRALRLLDEPKRSRLGELKEQRKELWKDKHGDVITWRKNVSETLDLLSNLLDGKEEDDRLTPCPDCGTVGSVIFYPEDKGHCRKCTYSWNRSQHP